MQIILVDDHIIFRQGLKLLLEAEGHEIIAELESAEALISKVQEVTVDLVLLDYRIPGGGSITALEYIKKRYEKIKVFVLTGVTSGNLYKALISSHADGVLMKMGSADELLAAIDSMNSGERYISKMVLEKISHEGAELTSRELQVLDLIFEGLNNSKIAERLTISNKTVDKHRTSLMRKLDVSNVVELMHVARQQGYLDD